jgi:hypothetical protein
MVAGAILFSGSTSRSAFGPLKGTDFIQFYTIAHLDARTAPSVLYNTDAFYRLQTTLVPDSLAERYLIVYPPHVVLLFRPFAGLSYGTALAIWDLILAAGYAVCVWLCWRPFRSTLDGRLLAAGGRCVPSRILVDSPRADEHRADGGLLPRVDRPRARPPVLGWSGTGPLAVEAAFCHRACSAGAVLS